MDQSSSLSLTIQPGKEATSLQMNQGTQQCGTASPHRGPPISSPAQCDSGTLQPITPRPTQAAKPVVSPHLSDPHRPSSPNTPSSLHDPLLSLSADDLAPHFVENTKPEKWTCALTQSQRQKYPGPAGAPHPRPPFPAHPTSALHGRSSVAAGFYLVKGGGGGINRDENPTGSLLQHSSGDRRGLGVRQACMQTARPFTNWDLAAWAWLPPPTLQSCSECMAQHSAWTPGVFME